VIESWRGDRGVRGVFPVLAGRGGSARIGTAGGGDELGERERRTNWEREEWTNWDGERSGTVPDWTVLPWVGVFRKAG
jgi:hypothetical protein